MAKIRLEFSLTFECRECHLGQDLCKDNNVDSEQINKDLFNSKWEDLGIVVRCRCGAYTEITEIIY